MELSKIFKTSQDGYSLNYINTEWKKSENDIQIDNILVRWRQFVDSIQPPCKLEFRSNWMKTRIIM